MPVENVRGRPRLRTASNGSVRRSAGQECRQQSDSGVLHFTFRRCWTVCHLACVTIDFRRTRWRGGWIYLSFRTVMDNIRCHLDASAVLSTLSLTYYVGLEEEDPDQIHRHVIPQERRHNGRSVHADYVGLIWLLPGMRSSDTMRLIINRQCDRSFTVASAHCATCCRLRSVCPL